MNAPDFLEGLEHRIVKALHDIFHPHESRIMASIALLTQTVTDLSANVGTLATAVETLVANQGTGQAQFEAQLDPVEQALEQLNGAITQLTGAVTAATPTA